MVDVVASSSYGYRLGAVSKWAMDVEEPLSTAINDFPKRGILVSIYIVSAFILLTLSGPLVAQHRSNMGLESRLPNPEQALEAAL